MRRFQQTHGGRQAALIHVLIHRYTWIGCFGGLEHIRGQVPRGLGLRLGTTDEVGVPLFTCAGQTASPTYLVLMRALLVVLMLAFATTAGGVWASESGLVRAPWVSADARIRGCVGEQVLGAHDLMREGLHEDNAVESLSEIGVASLIHPEFCKAAENADDLADDGTWLDTNPDHPTRYTLPPEFVDSLPRDSDIARDLRDQQ